MNLRDGVLQVRLAIGELRPRFWSDSEIIDHLNVSAKRMCSRAQCLQNFFTFETQVIPDGVSPGAGFQQEYALPIDVDQIIGASYFSGTIFPILPAPREAVQLGGKVGGIPWYFYLKNFTRTLAPQINGGELIQIPITGEAGAEYRTVLGLYPVPTSGIPIYLHYLEWHPTLKNPFDQVAIPDRFKQGWIAYAVARCREKQSAIQDAQYWDGIHAKATDEFEEYMIQNGQQITPPVYSNRPTPPYFLRGANTVLVVSQNPAFTNL